MRKPPAAAAPVTPRGPLLAARTPRTRGTLGAGSLTASPPAFPQRSPSCLVPQSRFVPAQGRRNSPDWCLRGESPSKEPPLIFMPSQSTCAQVSLSRALRSRRVPQTPSAWMAPPLLLPFVTQKVGSSRLLLCLPGSIPLAGTTLVVPSVMQRTGNSRPLVSGSHPEPDLHLSLQLANRATRSRGIPQHRTPLYYLFF